MRRVILARIPIMAILVAGCLLLSSCTMDAALSFGSSVPSRFRVERHTGMTVLR